MWLSKHIYLTFFFCWWPSSNELQNHVGLATYDQVNFSVAPEKISEASHSTIAGNLPLLHPLPFLEPPATQPVPPLGRAALRFLCHTRERIFGFLHCSPLWESLHLASCLVLSMSSVNCDCYLTLAFGRLWLEWKAFSFVPPSPSLFSPDFIFWTPICKNIKPDENECNMPDDEHKRKENVTSFLNKGSEVTFLLHVWKEGSYVSFLVQYMRWHSAFSLFRQNVPKTRSGRTQASNKDSHSAQESRLFPFCCYLFLLENSSKPAVRTFPCFF